ncbi:MAG: M28 family peptidase [Candidatus Latescibacteria bacterium]|nr:M28 family peptidase [Candidatus Latescibacterota bacterium]
MTFHGERAFWYAQRLSFPRLVGTPGERQAAAAVIETFTTLGYEVTEQPFPITRTPWGWMRVALTVSLVCLIGARLTVARFPLIAAALCVLVLCGLPVVERLWRSLARRGGSATEPALHSSNIIARRPGARPAPLSLTLYLMAHYDSKSQTISLPTRIVLMVTAGLGSVVFAATCLAAALSPAVVTDSPWLLAVATVPWALSIAGLLVLLAARTENRSPGGLDNAGSVGVLLALAEALREVEFREIDVVFVSTGAEELGLLGAYALVRQWKAQVDRSRAWVLNLDGVGVEGALRVTEGARLLVRPRSRYAALIRRIADRDGIPLRDFPILPGLLLDHIPFSADGLPATSLIGVSARATHIHTERDTTDLISPAGLGEAGRLVEGVMQELEGSGFRGQGSGKT